MSDVTLAYNDYNVGGTHGMSFWRIMVILWVGHLEVTLVECHSGFKLLY